MPLRSCLRCPLSFKCPLVWAGPGFRGSHGNPDSELIWRRFWENWPRVEGKTDISAVVLFFPVGVVWGFDISMSSWQGLFSGVIGCRWGWKVEVFSVNSEWLVCSHTDMQHYFHYSYLSCQHPSCHSGGVMFARPLAQTHINECGGIDASRCKLMV